MGTEWLWEPIIGITPPTLLSVLEYDWFYQMYILNGRREPSTPEEAVRWAEEAKRRTAATKGIRPQVKLLDSSGAE
eukprot:35192-Eustigmatos_ZCMA.PRE.1